MNGSSDARRAVLRAQRALTIGAMGSALAWGIAAALGGTSAAALIRMLVNAQFEIPAAAPVAIGVVLAGSLIWRARHVRSTARVALWLEERIPHLQYALVTAAAENAPSSPALERIVSEQPVTRTAARAALRAVVPALAAAAFTGLLLFLMPAFGVSTGVAGTPAGTFGLTTIGGPVDPLESVSVEVLPPAYSRRRSYTLADPQTISALTGSRIRIRGRGDARTLRASAANARIPVLTVLDGWSGELLMPRQPAPVTLTHAGTERVIVLDPRTDEAPKVELTSPLRDTTLRDARGIVPVAARVSDDVGLGTAYIEYLVTSGSGEVFSSRVLTAATRDLQGARDGTLRSQVNLASLALKPGDVLSIRAVARDVNTLYGPTLGTSDTRTYRIARPEEYDSLSVEAAGPVPVDSSAISQRMLILMTEELVAKERQLARTEFVRRSNEIADAEDRIRRRVQEIIEGAEEEHGDDPAEGDHEHGKAEMGTPQDPDLRDAFNALWEAVRALRIAEPRAALPPMRLALRALDRARLARRLYLRGAQPKIVVDLARIRLTGKDKGASSTRTAGEQPAREAAYSRRLSQAFELLESRPSDAMRALALLQTDAIRTAPALASAIAEALEAMRSGRDATRPLLRARRVLDGQPQVRSGIPAWSGSF